MSCPTPSQLQAYLDGLATPDDKGAMRAHLETCADCRALVLALAPDTPIDAVAPTQPGLGAIRPGERLQSGQIVGRYVVLNQVGEGGMGVVYAAYDPELDRKLALKIIRTVESDTAAHDLQDRLMREAQAMARVAHPNVVAAHDVGRHGTHVFVAMELIDGETLADWTRTPRSTAQIIDVFLRAGQGLAAAHSAGLVHRDFKPNNVMIDRDGRVRVMDFGLARPSGVLDETTPSLSPRRLDVSLPGPRPRLTAQGRATLTASGVLVGTPAYMAPEQLSRQPPDARSDQFGFCIALYEALCGTRPFVAPDTDELHAAIVSQRLQRPVRKAPEWIVRVVERGLRAAPSERWPSMGALLEALARDPSLPRRRWLAGAAAVVVLLAAGFTGVSARRATVQLCRGGDAQLAGVWDAARREAVTRAFAAQPGGNAGSPAVVAALDRNAAEWSAAYADNCAATRVRGEQSTELLDLRMACLHDRLIETSELVDLFAHADAELVRRAFRAVHSLEPPTLCSAERLVRDKGALPSDPALRVQATAISELLARETADDAAAHYADAQRLAAKAAAEAARAHLPGLEAEAQYSLGLVHEHLGNLDDAEPALRRAVHLALTSGRDEMLVRAAGSLGFLLGGRRHQFPAGHLVLDVARAGLERLGNRRDLEARLLDAEASVLDIEGKLDDALPLLRRAIELYRQSGDTVQVALTQRDLAHALGRNNRLAEAERAMRDSIASLIKVQGPDGQLVGNSEGLLCDILVALGRYDEAVVAAQHMLAVARKVYGQDSHHVANAYLNVGWALQGAKREEEAARAYQQVIDIGERIHDNDRLVPSAWQLLGRVLYLSGQLERARVTVEHALVHPLASLLPDLERGNAELTLAETLWQLGRERSRARALAADAEALFRKSAPGEVGDCLSEVIAWRKQHDRR